MFGTFTLWFKGEQIKAEKKKLFGKKKMSAKAACVNIIELQMQLESQKC